MRIFTIITMNVFWNRLKESHLFKDSFWALLGQILGKGLGLIAGIVVARLLGKEAYGEYGMIRNNLTLIATFSTLGLGYTATKFIAECKGDLIKSQAIHQVVTHITLITSSILMLLVVIFASPLTRWLEAPDLEGLLRLTSIAIIFNAVNTTQVGELSGFKAYKVIAKNNIWSGIITFIATIPLTYIYDVTGAIIALIISFAFNCLLNHLSIKKYLSKQDGINCSKNYRDILSFTFPVALQESSYTITHWVSTVLLIKFASYGELGLYSAATQWMAVMLFVPGALRNVVLSHLSENNNNLAANKWVLKRMSLVNFITTFVPFLIISSISGWICSWYGNTYYGLQNVLNVCMFTTVINSLTNVFTQNMIAMNQNWYLFITRLVRDLLILGVSAILLISFDKGALMYAMASLVFQTLYLLLLFMKQLSLYNRYSIT